MRRIAIAAFAAALLFAGCGGDGDGSTNELPEGDQTQIQLVTEQLVAAAKGPDGERLCGLLQPSRIDAAFGSEAKCAKRLASSVEGNGVFDQLDIESYEATDAGAIVTFKQNPPGEVPFIKEDGAWYLDLSGVSAAGPK